MCITAETENTVLSERTLALTKLYMHCSFDPYILFPFPGELPLIIEKYGWTRWFSETILFTVKFWEQLKCSHIQETLGRQWRTIQFGPCSYENQVRALWDIMEGSSRYTLGKSYVQRGLILCYPSGNEDANHRQTDRQTDVRTHIRVLSCGRRNM